VDAPISGGQRFRTGFLVAMSNPKAFVFFAALFPQFTRADMPQLPQWLALAVTFYVIESSWQLAYVYGGRRAPAMADQPAATAPDQPACGRIVHGRGYCPEHGGRSLSPCRYA
jgi:threonine/homoserine/homoserine lactone efflux protein